MLTKKEVKLAILAELQAIDTCIKFPNLHKYVEKRVEVLRRTIEGFCRVYNHQHKNYFMATDEIMEEILIENEEITKTLSEFYNASKYTLTYILLYRKEN